MSNFAQSPPKQGAYIYGRHRQVAISQVIVGAKTVALFAIIARKIPMISIRTILSAQISRRSLLEGAACAGSAATMLSTTTIEPAQAAKISQKVVNYQDSPKGAAMCGNCKLFVSPSSCQTVDGTISPNGWCSIYQKT
jgi:hypothetical protein